MISYKYSYSYSYSYSLSITLLVTLVLAGYIYTAIGHITSLDVNAKQLAKRSTYCGFCMVYFFHLTSEVFMMQ